MSRRLSFVVALSVALAIVAGPSLADSNKHWKGQGHGNSRSFVPPGLAKKPHGMPPGQYKKIQPQWHDHDHDRYYDRDRYSYRQGDDWRFVQPGYWRYTPPVNNGWTYVQPGMNQWSYARPYDDRRFFRYGDVIPGRYVVIDDYNRWRLPPPPYGQSYVQYDNGVYRVLRDTGTVMEALGIVSDLLR